MLELIGIDIRSSAANLAALRILKEASIQSEDHARVSVCNSIELSPNKFIPSEGLI